MWILRYPVSIESRSDVHKFDLKTPLSVHVVHASWAMLFVSYWGRLASSKNGEKTTGVAGELFSLFRKAPVRSIKLVWHLTGVGTTWSFTFTGLNITFVFYGLYVKHTWTLIAKQLLVFDV